MPSARASPLATASPRPGPSTLHHGLLRRGQAADIAAADIDAGAEVARSILDRMVVCATAQAQKHAGGERLFRRRAAQGHQIPRGPPRPQPRHTRHANVGHNSKTRGNATVTTRSTQAKIPIDGPADDTPVWSPLASKQEHPLESSAPAEHAMPSRSAWAAWSARHAHAGGAPSGV